MRGDDPDDLAEWAEAATRVARSIDRFERLLSHGTQHNESTITVNAGGVGVWIATTACLVMLAMMLVGSLWVSREFARYDQQLVEIREENKTMQTYLSAIYQQAPHLRPKEETE